MQHDRLRVMMLRGGPGLTGGRRKAGGGSTSMLLLVDDAHAAHAAPAGVALGAGKDGRVFGPADFEGPAYSNKVGLGREQAG